MEESPVHPRAVEQSHRAGIAVGKNRLTPAFASDRAEPLRDRIERFIPTDPLESAFAFHAYALLWIEQPLRRVLPLQILRDLSAQEPARYGMIGVAAQSRRPAAFDVHQNSARIGTIQRTSGVADLHVVQNNKRCRRIHYRCSCFSLLFALQYGYGTHQTPKGIPGLPG